MTPYLQRLGPRPARPGAILGRRRGMFEPAPPAPVDGPLPAAPRSAPAAEPPPTVAPLEVVTEAEGGARQDELADAGAPGAARGVAAPVPSGRPEPAGPTPTATTAAPTVQPRSDAEASVAPRRGAREIASRTTVDPLTLPDASVTGLAPADAIPPRIAHDEVVREGPVETLREHPAATGVVQVPAARAADAAGARAGFSAEPERSALTQRPGLIERSGRAESQPAAGPTARRPPHVPGVPGVPDAPDLPGAPDVPGADAARQLGELRDPGGARDPRVRPHLAATADPGRRDPMWSEQPLAVRLPLAASAIPAAGAGAGAGVGAPRERARPEPPAGPTELTVRIARIEVKAPPPPAPSPGSRPQPAPRRRPPSLDAYLQARSRGLAG